MKIDKTEREARELFHGAFQAEYVRGAGDIEPALFDAVKAALGLEFREEEGLPETIDADDLLGDAGLRAVAATRYNLHSANDRRARALEALVRELAEVGDDSARLSDTLFSLRLRARDLRGEEG